MAELPTLYQQQIHVRHYARWDDENQRRETWNETVDRYIQQISRQTKKFNSELTLAEKAELRDAIINGRALPSMRSLMSAGPALERDNVAGYNCFTADTEVLTSGGVRRIGDLTNGYANVLDGEGIWTRAEVRSFGRQPLSRVTFRPGERGRTKLRHVVDVTPDHRWITENRGEVTDLHEGDLVRFNAPNDSEIVTEAFVRGFGFGDGTIDARGRAKIRLCGEKDLQYVHLFEEYGNCSVSYPEYMNGDALVVFRKGHMEDWKQLPDYVSASWLASWFLGYFAADGCARDEQPVLCSQDVKAIEFAKTIAPYAGYVVTGQNTDPTVETNFGVRSAPLQRITLRREVLFRVTNVEDLEAEDEVFCAIVPTTGSFTLANGILTGNCSYVAVDHPRAFDETLYILCCGTGVGFSVERQYIKKLPEVAEEFHPTETTIVVEDSKIGWAKAFRELISLLYMGQIPRWNTTKVRKAGARLHTFGGRASGPGPLEDLFRFTVKTFQEAAGRRLTSTECHEIMCKIGDIVVVGGVRRSAMISLYNPSDDRMANIKSGEYWRSSPHLRLANNSAVWTDKPDVARFMEQQWLPLVKGKSGEPGIINRQALHRKVEENGRREGDYEFGTNPCVTADTWVMTDAGPRQVKDLIGKQHGSVVHGEVFQTTEDGFWETGVKSVFHLATDKGYDLRLTGNHEVLRVRHTAKKEYEEWVRVDELTLGDRIKLHDHRQFVGWPGNGNFAEGWLLGELKGDGNYSNQAGQVKFWGESRHEMGQLAVANIREYLSPRSDFTGCDTGTTMVVSCVGLRGLANEYEMTDAKVISPAIEQASSDFTRGFLRGLFDADGCVQGTQNKGISVRLTQTDLMGLKAIQRMLLRLGIVSTIYEGRQPAGMRMLPNGYGGLQEYWCNAIHELVISNDNLFVFRDLVGFYEPAKVKKLSELLSLYVRVPNRERFYAKVTSIIHDGEEAVYDCSVPGPNAFDANGMYVHNCGEIILRSCEFCNLSEVVARPEDDFDDLINKVRIATILGTIQSTFTNFRYIRNKWKTNCEEERLLGVSITGVADHPVLNGSKGEEELRSTLHALKHVAIDTNAEWAKRLGINQSVAITCNKPAGTTSKLMLSGSGINEWHSPYFVQRQRGNKVDPACQVMYYQGIPTEDDMMDPDNTWVFSWPIKAPDGALTREDMPALKKLNLWLAYAEAWCEHNPSTTINVRDEEWLEVGAFVHRQFDRIAGIAFLPYDDHVYHQAPYEAITEEEYIELSANMPDHIDWGLLADLETDDQTTAMRELACVSGSCDLDLTAVDPV